MLIAIISDIHSNREALEEVLNSVESQKADMLVCLGDIVGYGADPDYCVNTIREKAQIVIIGNHDHAALALTPTYTFNIYAKEAIEWTADKLSPSNIAYLEKLKFTERYESAVFVHSSPFKPEEWNYIMSSWEADWQFDYFTEKVCFIGHSHIPVEYTDRYGKRRIVNVGSVGQPRDNDPRSCYYLYDAEKDKGRWIRVKYPYEIAMKKIIDAGLPRILAERLARGR